MSENQGGFLSFTVYEMQNSNKLSLTLAPGTPLKFSTFGGGPQQAGIQMSITAADNSTNQNGEITVAENQILMVYGGSKTASMSLNAMLVATTDTPPDSVTFNLNLPTGCEMIVDGLNNAITSSGTYTVAL